MNFTQDLVLKERDYLKNLFFLTLCDPVFDLLRQEPGQTMRITDFSNKRSPLLKDFLFVRVLVVRDG